MKVPLSWLKEYVEIKEGTERLAEDLLLSGTKVESVEKEKEDVIFDFEITPNRSDCLSIIGIAREVAAIYNRRLTVPAAFSETQKEIESTKKINLAVLDKSLCPYYSIGIIDELKVSQSPMWLSERLEKSGIRSLSNIVDITNYVMTETGQPMHAFDYDKIKGKMVLRSSKEGEAVTTLDGVERKLPSGAIIIEDSEKLIDLAGLMGGASSEIDKNTKTVVLHVPVYDSLSVRRASQALGLRTEASNRFEKKLDPAAHRYAFERAYSLMKPLAGGKLASTIESVGYPAKEHYVKLPLSLVSDTLGVTIAEKEVCSILSRLNFETKLESQAEGKTVIVGVPSFRTDIHEPIDLIEEIGRIYGYNKFPKTLPVGPLPTSELNYIDFERKVKQILISLGLQEIYSSTLTSLLTVEDLGFDSEECLRVANRLIFDYEYLRPTLLVGILLAAKLNIENFKKFSLFELGRVFTKDIGKNGLPNQPKKIAAIFVDSDFRSAKGALETFLKKLNISGFTFKQLTETSRFGKEASMVLIGTGSIGEFGKIDSSILGKFEISSPTFWFELDLEALQARQKEKRYTQIPKFPVVKEELSLFLQNNLPFQSISESIKNSAGNNLYKMSLFEDTNIKGQRSVLIGLEYYSQKNTLDKKLVTKIRGKILTDLKKIGAQPRTSNLS
ncbi:MAG: phenylalanine--tRNA ligase subunit beta [Candidatus Woykebacteria bacterium RBG_13_40_15]|uniref:Phenylalanine--tRNA ligase beta subunit n=1 Tax=Candidatus Woykebacteria bacterium RBG_13_40_15 TaxID=1802593 RepID=A0A1G1W6Y9_9BACT|nr:MAG: phenylalanine--tRNA ligase subunit beta [Candidatus Woykebacteria bacterium RBG_13_40_15]